MEMHAGFNEIAVTESFEDIPIMGIYILCAGLYCNDIGHTRENSYSGTDLAMLGQCSACIA